MSAKGVLKRRAQKKKQIKPDSAYEFKDIRPTATITRVASGQANPHRLL